MAKETNYEGNMEKNFIWGVATAAYQIEGGYREDGKGDSIWDVFSHDTGRIKHGDTGDIACDHYHRYKEDVALLKELGVEAYRFSIAWTRIFPDGIGTVNEKGVSFYNNLINELLKNNITPYVTLFHWDYPQKLFEKGGWLNPESPKWFGEYARKIGLMFGDRVKHFITINEPQCILGGHKGGAHAPGLKYSLKDQLQITHNLLKAHGEAVKELRETVLDAKIGFAPCGWVLCPKNDTEEEIDRAKRAYFTLWKHAPTESVVLFSDPVLLGDYPKEYYQIFKKDLPEIKKSDLELISQPLDFYGQNIYSGNYVTEKEDGEFIWETMPSDFPRNSLGWNIIPKALYWGTKFLYERYKKPIYITENGMPNLDIVSIDGEIHDPQRIDFIERYSQELMKAKAEGIPIEGYFYWSLLDNFEWAEGYEPRFGLVYVDYNTQKRIPKDSFYYYQKKIMEKIY